jgi:hypothetical protein
MAHPRMVDAFVRELLDAAFGGDVGVQGRRYILPLAARPVVEVVPATGHALRVRVAAPVATHLAAHRDLLEELNEVNADLPYGRVFLVDGRVWVEHTVHGATVDGEVLENAVDVVCWAVRTLGDRFAAAGHGRPAVTADPHGARGQGDATPAPGRANGVDVGEPATQLQLTPTGDEPLTDAPVAVNAAGYL